MRRIHERRPMRSKTPPATTTRRARQPPKRRDGEPGGAVPSADAIARRAYELYERRGRSHGSDWADWLDAERELRSLN
jgi:DUF2934 family protein